jgi:Rv0078B-related antitoxin
MAKAIALRSRCRHRQLQYNFLMTQVSDAFRTTLDLFDTGLDLMRQNLRHEHPEADADDIDRRLRQWLHERPGAESGDGEGRPVDLAARLR